MFNITHAQPPSAAAMGKSLIFLMFCILVHHLGVRIHLLPFALLP